MALEFPNQFLNLAFVSQPLEFADEIKCILAERKNELPEFPLREIIKTVCWRDLFKACIMILPTEEC